MAKPAALAALVDVDLGARLSTISTITIAVNALLLYFFGNSTHALALPNLASSSDTYVTSGATATFNKVATALNLITTSMETAITTSAGTASGTTIQLTFPTQLNAIPVGSKINVAGMTADWNGTGLVVTASSLTTVSYASAAVDAYTTNGTVTYSPVTPLLLQGGIDNNNWQTYWNNIVTYFNALVAAMT
jgi:hypothetical protein